jgi:hypothetical protein
MNEIRLGGRLVGDAKTKTNRWKGPFIGFGVLDSTIEMYICLLFFFRLDAIGNFDLPHDRWKQEPAYLHAHQVPFSISG